MKRRCCGALVYRIRAFSDGHPRLLRRLAGDDKSGTLDVGESGHAYNRLNALARVFDGRSGSHRAAWEFRSYDFVAHFPVDQLRVDLLAVPTKNHAVAIECALLEEYRTTFLDRPPLNATSGKPDAVERWLQKEVGTDPARDHEGWLRLDAAIPLELLL